MTLKQSNLSWITVSDFSKAKDFFKEKLGLELTVNDEKFQWAEFKAGSGGQLLGLCPPSDGFKAGTNAIVTFTVDNINQSKQELEAKGVKMIGDIMEVPNIVKLQLFQDDDGNRFQLVEEMKK